MPRVDRTNVVKVSTTGELTVNEIADFAIECQRAGIPGTHRVAVHPDGRLDPAALVARLDLDEQQAPRPADANRLEL